MFSLYFFALRQNILETEIIDRIFAKINKACRK